MRIHIEHNDSVGRETLHDELLTTARGVDQKLSRFSNIKTMWSLRENRFLWKCYEKNCYPLRNGYMVKIYALWINEGMRNLAAQRLRLQVKNIKKT